MLYKNLASQKLVFYVANSVSGEPLTGISATITAKGSKDGAAFASLTNNPSELEGGIYTLALTQGETNGDVLAFIFTCTNPNARILPQIFYTSDASPTVTLGSASLDSVSVVLPTGPAANFREQMNLLYRRFFGKSDISAAGGINVYDTDNTTILTTQTVTDNGTTQTIGDSV